MIQSVPTMYFYHSPIITSNILLKLQGYYFNHKKINLSTKQFYAYAFLHGVIYYGLPFIFQYALPPDQMEIYQGKLFRTHMTDSYISFKRKMAQQNRESVNEFLQNQYDCSNDMTSIIWEFVGEDPTDPVMMECLPKDLMSKHWKASCKEFVATKNDYSLNPLLWRLLGGTNPSNDYYSRLQIFGQFCGWVLIQAVSTKFLEDEPNNHRMVSVWLAFHFPFFLLFFDLPSEVR